LLGTEKFGGILSLRIDYWAMNLGTFAYIKKLAFPRDDDSLELTIAHKESAMRFPLILTSLCLICLPALALSEYEAYLQQNTMDMQAANQEFQDYLDANDKEFIGFLKQQWKKVELEKPQILDITPKPVQLPKAPTPVTKPKPHEKPLPIVKVKPITPAKPVVVAPQVNVTPKKNMMVMEFVGHKISMPKINSRPLRFNNKLGSKTIASHWQVLAKAKHSHLVKALKQQKTALNLNDWAVALLANQYAKTIGLSDTNSQQLFTWFLLVKAGYNTRLAYNSQAFVLMPSKQALYGVTYFTMKGQRFYAVSFDGKKINTGRAFTYAGNHDIARTVLNFSGASHMAPSGNYQQKKLKFKFDKKQHQIKLDYDLALVKFSNTLPQLDIQYYPQQGLPAHTSQQLLKQLQPLVKGKTEEQAVNLLLRFVQTAFAYQTDGQQFNTENYLLPIETLHYPYSDCEDRASLFSWLVESLLGLDAVLLDYPGHIAAAVEFTKTPKGDRLTFKNKRYTITDPTYINASAGMTMPQFKKVQPRVVNF